MNNFEIERKFLVYQTDEYHEAIKNAVDQVHIIQGFLSTDPEKVIRIRISMGLTFHSDKAFLTVKGKNAGSKRREIETDIDLKIAKDLLDHFAEGHIIQKNRAMVRVGDLIWEVDRFGPPHYGLIVAEVELESEDQEVILPPWAGLEVTTDYRYSNSSLSQNSWPFK